ncbi:MAG: hypothetical protein U0744_07795 [Gemmataceae bacterium]
MAAIFFTCVAFALRFSGFSTRATFGIFIPAFYFAGRTIALWGRTFGYWLATVCAAVGVLMISCAFIPDRLPAFLIELERDNDFILLGIGGITMGMALTVTTKFVHSDS